MRARVLAHPNELLNREPKWMMHAIYSGWPSFELPTLFSELICSGVAPWKVIRTSIKFECGLGCLKFDSSFFRRSILDGAKWPQLFVTFVSILRRLRGVFSMIFTWRSTIDIGNSGKQYFILFGQKIDLIKVSNLSRRWNGYFYTKGVKSWVLLPNLELTNRLTTEIEESSQRLLNQFFKSGSFEFITTYWNFKYNIKSSKVVLRLK